ncbi:MAG: BlaI/MecI/CopY family transcriptional regulator [Planctomycetes bacterium]|nr:BlaI/MecI/CopY family transcriptional regulator [Planctomycetota bacterium]
MSIVKETLMGKHAPHITAAELRIMKVIWRMASGTVHDVRDAIVSQSKEQPAYTTVMTLMNQLAGKGALAVDRQRQPYVYRAAVRKEQVLSHRLKQFIQTVFDGQAGELALRLVEECDLSPDDLKRIEAKIDDRESSKKRSGGEHEAGGDGGAA